MNMLPVRYISVRERLIELYNIINNRMYGIWIAPKSMMTVEEIRNREEYMAGDGTIQDKHFFDESQLRTMKLTQLLCYIDNFTSSQEIGFKQPNTTVVQIYESIQEYLSLWCEVMLNAPEHQSPPMSELRQLEKLAYIVYPTYKDIKPFVTNKEVRDIGRDDATLNKQGLMGLGALFQMANMGNKKNQDLSWVSHLDEFEGRYVSGGQITDIGTLSALYYPPATVNPVEAPVVQDSIRDVEPQGDLANWLFKEQ